jgi:hypothetical protein
MASSDSRANPALALHTEQVASLIFVADRAVGVVKAAGESADAINAANLGDLFVSIHGAMLDLAVLAVAKLFERPSSRHRIWSLPALLSEIQAGAAHFEIVERSHAFAFIREHSHAAELALTLPDSELITVLAQTMQAQLPDLRSTEPRTHDLALDALRQQRDKVIAHNEAVDHGTLLSVSWQQLENLLRLAKNQVGAIGWIFLRAAYTTDDGSYVLSDDASRTGVAMRRLLTKAGLRPDSPVGRAV